MVQRGGTEFWFSTILQQAAVGELDVGVEGAANLSAFWNDMGGFGEQPQDNWHDVPLSAARICLVPKRPKKTFTIQPKPRAKPA